MNNIITIDAADFLAKNYLEYGAFVNLQRVVPYIDGLKPSQRRILLTLNAEAKGKHIATSSAIGLTQHLYHPFGDISIEDALAELARKNVVSTVGDFGVELMETLKHAAPRYTSIGLTNEQANYYFRLSKYAPKVDGEIAVEPEFLVTPVPLALITGSFSWGLGMISRSPAFTYASLLEAYKKDDPSLLQSSYGYAIDLEKSELKALWEKGKGRLGLKYEVRRLNYDTIQIRGSAEIFKPNLAPLNGLIEKLQIEVEDDSTQYVSLIIRRLKGARSVDMNEVFETVKKLCAKTRGYELQVILNGKILTLGIRDWLQVTMTTFSKAFEQNKVDTIAALEEKIKVLEILPSVLDMVKKDYTPEQMAAELKVPVALVMLAGKRSLFSARKAEYSKEIDSIKNSIELVKAESAVAAINSFASFMNNVAANPIAAEI